ncbi:MAG: PIG-L family deacetylase [Gemmatimonadaceae bacterium]
MLRLSRLAAALLLAGSLAPSSGICQTRQDLTTLAREVAAAGVTTRVLMIGAHPDDEDSALLAWLAAGGHADVAYLSLTRGEGGQNFIGDERGDLLGVVRTEELLAARRADGAHQFFARAYDFGFSKSADEALARWGHDSTLRDVATVIRAYKPHIIISVWQGTSADGHGHHKASGMLAREAFRIAGDSTALPASSTSGLRPWAPAAIYSLVFRRSATPVAGEGNVAIDAGEYDPVIGESYAQLAARGRSMHKSQEQGTPQRRGAEWHVMQRVGTTAGVRCASPTTPTLFDCVDTRWARLGRALPPALTSSLDSIQPALAAARRALGTAATTNPEALVVALARLHRLERRLSAAARAAGDADAIATLDIALRRSTRALAGAASVQAEAVAASDMVAVGDSVAVRLAVRARDGVGVRVLGVRFGGTDVAPSSIAQAAVKVAAGDSLALTVQLAGARPTQPWWLADGRRGDSYAAPVEHVAEDLRTPSAIALVSAVIAGDSLELAVPVVRRRTDPIEGDVEHALLVVPAVSVAFERPIEYLRSGVSVDRNIHVIVRTARSGDAAVAVRLELPPGLTSQPTSQNVLPVGNGRARVASFHVTGTVSSGNLAIRAIARADGAEFSRGYVPVAYAHIEPRMVYSDARLALDAVAVKLPSNTVIGYVKGATDDEPAALSQLGFDVRLLDPDTLADAALDNFGAIVIGPRAYARQPSLVTNNRYLLDYVRRGGTMVVQFGREELRAPGLFPYPLTVSLGNQDRVTDETSPVTILDSAARVLNYPNRITAADFSGWTQERATYIPREFDPRYQTVLALHDPGGEPMPGALLIAPLGRGNYIYCSLALFRQLPDAVPGAARIMANLLAASEPRPAQATR